MSAHRSAQLLAPELLRQKIADGTAVICRNVKHTNAPPLAVGEGLRTKTNANIGTSKDDVGIDKEVRGRENFELLTLAEVTGLAFDGSRVVGVRLASGASLEADGALGAGRNTADWQNLQRNRRAGNALLARSDSESVRFHTKSRKRGVSGGTGASESTEMAPRTFCR